MSFSPQDATPEVVLALATLRLEARKTSNGRNVQQAMDVLDNAQVFSVIDEATDYAAPMDLIQEAAEASIPNTLDPAEWGDTTSADMARHQGDAVTSDGGPYLSQHNEY